MENNNEVMNRDVDDEIMADSPQTTTTALLQRTESDEEENLLDNPGASVAEVKAKQAVKKRKTVPKYSWTTDATEALIDEWKLYPILFDCTHAEYHVKEKRRIAVDKIRQKMVSDHEIDPAPSSDEIVKKMNNLRTYFNAERNKQEASKVCIFFF